jgi:hypothetical protein
MKNTHAIVLITLASLFGFSFLSSSCAPKEQENIKPAITVTTYVIKKIPKDQAHAILSKDLRGLASSFDGEFVYVVGNAPASLMAFEVDKNKWHQALGDFKSIQKAVDHTNVDLSAHKIDAFDGFSHGILFTLSGNNGLVILKGIGVANSSHYPQGANKFPHGSFKPLFLTDKDKNNYVYLFLDGAIARKGVLFRPYLAPPTNDTTLNWDNSLKKNGGYLDTQIFAQTQDQKGNLLVADKFGIKQIKELDVGEAGKLLDKGGAAIFPSNDFRLDNATKNDQVNTMQVIDDKFLVLGLESTGYNNGGVAVKDLTDPNSKWRHFGKGLGISAHAISPERFKNKDRTRIAALITTNKGFLFLTDNGQMLEIDKDKNILVNGKLIHDTRAETDSYDKAQTGFTGDLVPDLGNDSYLRGAQDKNALWYLGLKGKTDDDGGLFTLEPKINTVQAPREPPVLP